VSAARRPRGLVSALVVILLIGATRRASASGPPTCDEQLETCVDEPHEPEQPAPPSPAAAAATGIRSSRSYVLALEPSIGVGTPLGWLGGSVVVTPHRSLALDAGLGLGSQGVQIAGGGRTPVLRKETASVWLGASWSSGRFAQVGATTLAPSPTGDGDILYWRRAHFINVEASLERDLASRIGLRAFGGIGWLVNRGDAICPNRLASERCSDMAGIASFVPYAGVALVLGVL
jgi:hypothetical protein